MKARVVSVNDLDGSETIECNGHRIQYGYGNGGDGFCHTHGSFDCIDNLTEEEKEAILNATPLQQYTLASGHTNKDCDHQYKLHLVPYRDPEKDSAIPPSFVVDEPVTVDAFILELEKFVSSLIEFQQGHHNDEPS